MTDPIIPSPDEIIGPGITSLVSLRPTALPYINNGFPGTYGEVFVGYRGQATKEIEALSDLVKNGRLNSATGDALKALAASEFDSLENDVPAKSVGLIEVHRSIPATAGVIPAGTRVKRSFSPLNPGALTYAVSESFYVTTVAVQFNVGDTGAFIPITSEATGSFTNTPLTNVFPTPYLISFADPVFDTFVLNYIETAGGSDGVTDPVRRRYATAFYTGQYAPTLGSIIAGTFKDGSVKHAIIRDDPTRATTNVYIADSSWGSSAGWAQSVKGRLQSEGWVGFGCRVRVGIVFNIFLTISANVTVKKQEYLSDTSPILADIQTAVQSYFDDRPDWNTWKLVSLRGAIIRANRRIQTVTSLTVTGTNTITSQPVSEPSGNSQYGDVVYGVSTYPFPFTYHYSPQGVTMNFLSPV